MYNDDHTFVDNILRKSHGYVCTLPKALISCDPSIIASRELNLKKVIPTHSKCYSRQKGCSQTAKRVYMKGLLHTADQIRSTNLYEARKGKGLKITKAIQTILETQKNNEPLCQNVIKHRSSRSDIGADMTIYSICKNRN